MPKALPRSKPVPEPPLPKRLIATITITTTSPAPPPSPAMPPGIGIEPPPSPEPPLEPDPFEAPRMSTTSLFLTRFHFIRGERSPRL